MIKKYKVGSEYKVGNASLSPDLKEVLDSGALTLPSVFTCSSIDGDGDCYSVTKGVTWRGIEASLGSITQGKGWMCADRNALDTGAIIEVEAV